MYIAQKCLVIFLAGSTLFLSCNESKTETQDTISDSVSQLNYTVLDTLAHDTTSFTEGLVFFNNELYESTGSPEELPSTRSLIGVVDADGLLRTKAELDKKYFGEGITILNGSIYQLTYKHQKGFVYSWPDFRQVKEFQYQNKEGWGLTHDSLNLIMSDGTHELTFLNPANFQKIKTLNVRMNGYGQTNINELEYAKGYIYANIWQTNQIIKIDPSTGEVVGSADFSDLKKYVSSIYAASMEMNGIAYDKISGDFYITGKMWPKVFRIRLR